MKRTTIALFSLAIVVALVGLVSWSLVTVQAEPIAVDLDRISEATGYVATMEPLSDDCVFDSDYQVYLCEQPRDAMRPASDPEARAEALALAHSHWVLMIPDSIAGTIMLFDATTGNLIDDAFIELDEDATGLPIQAIRGPTGQILVSDQTRNVVHQYDVLGNYMGVFAPAGGENTAILQNIRGMALRPNGNLLVTVGAGANASSVAEFDSNGAYLGNFIAAGAGGLDSPFDVYQRGNTDWLVSSINSNQVLSYAVNTGAPIGQFAMVDGFPQQIWQAANGNVLVANFSGTQMGIVELTSAGALVNVYDPDGLDSYRGVYELPNNNLLVSTSAGVYEISRAGTLVDTKYLGQARFIEPVILPSPLELEKTVGHGPECATTNQITVVTGHAATYCFNVTNNTALTLTLHDLVDSQLGVILDNYAFSLGPQASVFVTQTAVITQPTVNTATWTAYNPGPVDVFEAMDSATVSIRPEGLITFLPIIFR